MKTIITVITITLIITAYIVCGAATTTYDDDDDDAIKYKISSINNNVNDQRCIDITSTQDGSCGSNVRWKFHDSDNTLTINGTGEMYNYSSIMDVPWCTIRDKINNIVIEEGITSIGNNVFSNLINLKDR